MYIERSPPFNSSLAQPTSSVDLATPTSSAHDRDHKQQQQTTTHQTVSQRPNKSKKPLLVPIIFLFKLWLHKSMIVHLWPRPWLTQSHKWQETLDMEYSSIFKNNIWELTNVPLGKTFICCKWILYKKHIVNVIFGHHKVKLMACRFSIHYKFNFHPLWKSFCYNS
jgi:hypothetical protein